MKAPPFRYLKPRSLDECLDLLAEHGDAAQILAGGQSLMPLMNLRMARPDLLIDINGLAELAGIAEQDGAVAIGGLTRHSAIAASEVVRRRVPMLSAAAPHIAHVAIRSRGTLGGSLALADPAAEWPVCALALEADIELTSRKGSRWVAAREFFQGIYSTARRPDEIITAVRFPVAKAGNVHLFDEITRRHGDFAIVGIAIVMEKAGATPTPVRIALCGVADRPILAAGAMRILAANAMTPSTIEAAVAALKSELEPDDDPAYPAAYRRHVAGALLQRMLRPLLAEKSHAA